jgi:hypothetical protein
VRAERAPGEEAPTLSSQPNARVEEAYFFNFFARNSLKSHGSKKFMKGTERK